MMLINFAFDCLIHATSHHNRSHDSSLFTRYNSHAQTQHATASRQ